MLAHNVELTTSQTKIGVSFDLPKEVHKTAQHCKSSSACSASPSETYRQPFRLLSCQHGIQSLQGQPNKPATLKNADPLNPSKNLATSIVARFSARAHGINQTKYIPNAHR